MPYIYTIRNFVNKHILRTIYFAIFDTHINYANFIWGQNLNAIDRIVILQKKALRIMNFNLETLIQVHYSSPTIFLNLKTKYLQGTYSINKSFNNVLPSIFKSWFMFCSSHRTDSFGKNSITVGAINSWNKTQH